MLMSSVVLASTLGDVTEYKFSSVDNGEEDEISELKVDDSEDRSMDDSVDDSEGISVDDCEDIVNNSVEVIVDISGENEDSSVTSVDVVGVSELIVLSLPIVDEYSELTSEEYDVSVALSVVDVEGS